MQFRHELKHEINLCDLMILKSRLKAVCKTDSHAADGKYMIRSLYFDDACDTALREKLDGVCNREKFRIRFYNMDASFIRLEKKVKRNSLGYKESCTLSEEEARAIANKDFAWMKDDPRPLVRELYQKHQTRGLVPKTIVDYTREPFLYAPGNVRVTFDYNIRTGLSCTNLLDPDCPTVPVREEPIIMEVKWDDYLPSIIKDIIGLDGRRTGAFSKYAACRAYD